MLQIKFGFDRPIGFGEVIHDGRTQRMPSSFCEANGSSHTKVPGHPDTVKWGPVLSFSYILKSRTVERTSTPISMPTYPILRSNKFAFK